MADMSMTSTSLTHEWEAGLQDFIPLPDGPRGVENAISSRYFPFELHPARADMPLLGAMDTAQVGAMRMTRIYNNAPFFGRRKRAQPQEQHCYVLGLCEDGHSIEIDCGRKVTVRQGDLYLMNSRLPFETAMQGAGVSLGIAFDAQSLRSRFADVDDWCFRTIPSSEGSAAVLRATMHSIWAQRQSLDNVCAQGLMAAAANLIGATFADHGDVPASLSRGNTLHFLRLREIVSANLENPELSADFLSERLGLSKSMVFKLMAQSNTTVGRFIMEKRLEWARARLAENDGVHSSISDIAFAAGFQDLSHFSRRFSSRYGASPRAFQRAARQGGGGKSC